MKIKINNQLKNVIVKFENELDFNKTLSSLKKYNMRAYKQLFLKINELCYVGGNEYRINLITEPKFKKIYGQVYIKTLLNGNELIIKRLEPYNFFKAGHKIELKSYRGIPIISKKEKFKLDLLEEIGGLNERNK